ncbi:HIT domain-containing protein [Dyella dinghuensis]|uniref:HIT domain-containing protein n=1 Tax=Dyella dinghuensis TaxID=1920169 RepID=A0A3S0RG75_9GAMM|nr:HIT domain-containing protein [Dyella dinghuensis]RUL66596.1 HIT domain-containing protein [Dyella dinghuensis]
MRAIDFNLDPNLQACTHFVTSLPLCDVLLMNDARFPWLILVPRRPGMVEMIDLPSELQLDLWREINHASAVLRDSVPCYKLNIGALGNITRQLHVHVIARTESDSAWPGPVWGFGRAEPYAEGESGARIALLKSRFTVEVS